MVGDGALTGGMAWEALNNLAAAQDRPVVIVVNDNERSYAPTIGGLAHHLATLRTTRGYEKFLGWGRTMLGRTPVVGQPLFDTLHGMKKGLKDMVAPQGLFEDLGLKYVGPVDGHDVLELEHALRRAKAFRGPVIVHALTRKGLGYAPAENDDADRFHGVGVIDPETGRALAASGPTWTGVFSDAIVEAGRERDDVVAITAAMLQPVGLARIRRGIPRPCLRRRHRRAARGHLRRRSCLCGHAPGGRGLRHVHEPRLRPGADGCRAAQGAGHLRPRPGRRHRRRRRLPQRHVGPVDLPDRPRAADRSPARRPAAARALR